MEGVGVEADVRVNNAKIATICHIERLVVVRAEALRFGVADYDNRKLPACCIERQHLFHVQGQDDL